MIIKQALILAHRAPERYSAFEALHGLVFLSTPHLPNDNSPACRQLLGILLAQVKKFDGQLASETELQSLARVSQTFQDMATSVRVLSTFETKETQLKGKLQYGSSERLTKCTLVDRTLARTGAPRETLEPIHADHRNACILDERDAQRMKVVGFVASCLDGQSLFSGVPEDIGDIPLSSDLSKLQMRNPSWPEVTLAEPNTGSD